MTDPRRKPTDETPAKPSPLPPGSPAKSEAVSKIAPSEPFRKVQDVLAAATKALEDGISKTGHFTRKMLEEQEGKKSVTEERDRLKTEAAGLRQQLSAAKREKEEVRAELAAKTAELEEANRERERLQEENEALTSQALTLAANADKLRKILDGYGKALDEAM